MPMSASGANATYHMASTGDGSTFTFAHGLYYLTSTTMGASAAVFTIERVPNGFIILSWCDLGQFRRHGYAPYSGAFPGYPQSSSSADGIGHFAPLVPYAATTLENGSFGLYPCRAYYGTHESYASRRVMVYLNSDIPRRETIQVDGLVDGVQTPFYTLGLAASTNYGGLCGYTNSVSSLLGLAIAWD
jgi:hypothetical protein